MKIKCIRDAINNCIGTKVWKIMQISCLILFLGIAQSLAATSALQQKKISGNVKDDTGEPLPGVTVIIKGTYPRYCYRL